MRPKTRLALALATVASAGAAVAACVLADPPPIVNPPPITRPVILTDSVSPPLDQKILSAPGNQLEFSVPVQVDPDQSLKVRVFVDLDPNGDPTKGGPAFSRVDDGGVLGTTPADGGSVAVRDITFPLSTQLDLSKCHTITVVVAYDFVSLLSASPVDPPGGDRATWFYEPTEDCSYFDAAPPTDASAQGDGADE